MTAGTVVSLRGAGRGGSERQPFLVGGASWLQSKDTFSLQKRSS